MADALTNRVRRLLAEALTNRVRLLAEAAVIMVSPVLLAIALKKVNLKSEEHGRVVPIIMLVVAAVTLMSAICPFLFCCISKRFSNDISRLALPLSVTKWLAPLCCVFLIALASWIIRLILSDKWYYPAIGAVFVLCIVVRSVVYCCKENAQESDHATVSKLENSLEFLSGVTALLFLGLEGLALEGQINSNQVIQSRLADPMGSSFVACVFGVFFMLVETIPLLTPSDNNAGCYGRIISNYTWIFDALMAFAVGVVMFLITYRLVKVEAALLLLVPPILIVVVDAYVFAVGGGGEDPKPASLELTKVTFTGFLAVSVPAFSSDSINKCTACFLVIAALAVVSGLVWRLLTHTKLAAPANVASFCAHLCVAIATVPFTVMAVKALA